VLDFGQFVVIVVFKLGFNVNLAAASAKANPGAQVLAANQ
jgi:hypothetical protein